MVPLAGCTSVFENDQKVGIKDISFVNLDPEPHTLHVEVKRGEELVYENTRTLRETSEFGTAENPAPVVNEEWMSVPGEYTVSVRDTETGQSYEHRFPRPEENGDCYGVSVRVHRGGRLSMPWNSSTDCESGV